MDKEKKFLISLVVCTGICIVILAILMYNFIQVLITGF